MYYPLLSVAHDICLSLNSRKKIREGGDSDSYGHGSDKLVSSFFRLNRRAQSESVSTFISSYLLVDIQFSLGSDRYTDQNRGAYDEGSGI